jgi:hypothetical protein
VGLAVREPVAVPEAVRVPDGVGEPLLDADAATGSTNSPCAARPVPKLRPTSDWPQHHTPALACSAHACVPPTMLTSMKPLAGAPAVEKSGDTAESVLAAPCVVVPISVGSAVSSAPTPAPAQSTPPVPPCRKHDAREATAPPIGLVQFVNAPIGAASAGDHG